MRKKLPASKCFTSKITFFCCKKITCLAIFLIAILPFSEIQAQFFVSVNSSTGVPDAGSTGTFSFSICDTDPEDAWFTVDFNSSVTGATNPRVEITLPTGFDYVDGSLENLSAPLGPTGATESGGVITFPMANMVSGDGGSFRFRLNMDCSTIAFLVGNQATLQLDAFSDEGNTSHTTGAFSNTIGIPNLVNNLSNNTNVTYTSAVVGTPYTRSYALLQNGLNKAILEEFEVCMTYGAGLTVSDIELVQGGTIAPVTLSGGCVTVNSANFPTLTFPLSASDELLWQETITPNGCDNLTSRADWSWGCSSTDCQSGFLTFGTSLEDNSPSFSVTSISRTINGCIEDGADVEAVYELDGLAYDLGFIISANVGNTYIDNSVAVEIDTGTGYVNYTGGMNNVTNNSHCGGSEPISYSTDVFSGPFDARTSPMTFRVRYRIRTCCPSGSCSTTTRTILGTSPDIFADDMCGDNFQISADVTGVYMGVSTSDLVPAYIANGEVATWEYSLNNIPNLNQFNNTGQVCMDFSLETPLQYQAGSIEWVDALGANPYTPSGSTTLTTEVITSTGTGTDIYVCFDVGDEHGDGSKIRFDARYDCTITFCSAIVDTDMKIGYRFGDETCTDDCIFPFLCELGETTLGDGCCPGTCDGMTNLYTNIQRNCFGLPDNDNDGCEDTAGAIDLNLIALDRAMEGDELVMNTAGRVNLTDPTDSFNYIFFDLVFPNAHEIGSTQSLSIYDASTTMYYSCDQLNVFAIDANTIRYYLTTDFLRGCNDVPMDFIFQNGDSLLLTSTFVNLNNPGCLVEQVNIGADWYAVRNGDPDVDPHLACNLPIPGAYSQVGYSLSVAPMSQNAYGCVGARFRHRVTFCIGGGDYRIQPFPYEIRNFMLPKQSGLLIPEGLNLEFLLLTNIQFTRYFNESYLSESEDVTAIAKQVGDYILLDWSDYFEDCTNNHMPNGGYRFDIEGRFQGTCAAGPSQAEWYYEADMDFCSPAVTDEVVRLDGNHSGNLPVTVPNLLATTTQPLIQPFSDIASWDFNIEETVDANADNAWAIIVSPSGGIIPTTLSSSGTINPVDGVYSLGDYLSGEDNNYQLDVNYTSCSLDSILLIYGWDCDGIPISDQQVIQGGLPCPVDTLILYLAPASGGIQQQVLEGPTSVVPCSNFTYEIEIKNVGIATLYEPVFEIFLPYTSGMDIDSLSPEICYPCNASNPVTYNYPTVPPTEIITNPLGIKHIWNLEAIVGTFDITANPAEGWLGESQVVEANKRLRIRFDASTNCDFIGGDYINFKTVAQTWCGEDVRSSLQNSVPLNYNIPDPAFSGAINLNIDNPIDGCQVGDEVVLDGNLFLFGPTGLGLTTTDGMDTLIVALPSALIYSSVAFNPAHVSNTTPIINVIGPGVGGVTFQELRWGINAGATLGSSIPFEIKTTLDPTKVLCEDDNAVFMRTVRAANFTCGADPCAASVTTASAVELIDFELNELSVSGFDVVANCGMTNLNVVNLSIENTGSFPVVEDVMVDFYYDADNSGNYSAGDVLIGSQTYSDDIPVGGIGSLTAGPFSTTADQTCKLIAFVSGCNCETIAATANSIRTQNAGADALGCSSDDFTLGCGEDNRGLGFEYQWFGLNGASTDSLADPTDPNTTLSYSHFNGSDITLEYILLTTHPGGVCNSVDTVSISLKGVDIAKGPLLKICPDSLLAFNGPTGFFNYSWSPTTNVTDVINPQSTVAAPVGIQTYTLTYNDLEGCEQYFQQTVSGVNCTDLELFKEVDVSSANIGDIVTYNIRVINQGPNGASGVEVADTLPSQLTYLSSVPAGQYDAASSIWTIPGILLPNDTVRLTIYTQLGSGGPAFNVAEISNMTQGDVDSTPNNDDDSEDDQQGVCTSVSVDIACRETTTIGVPDEFASYQWYRDNVIIAGATNYEIAITEPGSYLVEVNGGDCPYGNCCPFEVVEEPCANIGNYVFQDLDGNGAQDTGEGGIENVMVILYDANTGLAVDTAFTDASGNYLFEELPTGNYNITFDATTNINGLNYVATTQNGSGDDTTDSDASPTDGTTGPFSFDASSGDDLTWDAGYSTFADIGDFVWVDLNQDGLQEFIESGVENVGVTLYDTNTGLAVDMVFTDMDGAYLFEDVPYGDYYIEFDLSSVVGSQEYEFTTSGSGDGTNDSEVDPATNTTPTFTFNPAIGNDLTHDAGVLPNANIGNLVWVDANGDGVYDSGTESGLDSVLVVLYDANTNTPLDTIYTDTNGNYLFSNISSGNYYIDFDFSTSPGQDFVWTSMDAAAATNATDSDVNASNGQTDAFSFDATNGNNLTFDAGVIPVADLGDFVWDDADGDGIQDPSETGVNNVMVILYDEDNMMPLDTVFTDSNGAFLFPNLFAGNYSLIFDSSTNATGDEYNFTNQGSGTTANDSDPDPSTGQTDPIAFDPTIGDDLTIDAGLYQVADIGNFVWVDDDMDGIQDAMESGLDSVLVILFDAGSGTAIDSAWTDAMGMYLFEEIAQGDYYIGFEPNASFGNMNYGFGPAGSGNGSNDSDADNNGFTGVINFDPSMGDDLTLDAGISPSANIGDFVWVDRDGDGEQDIGELGVENVTVILYDANIGLAVDSVLTDMNGNYLFGNVPSGDYYIVFDPSTSMLGADYSFAPQGAGTSATDSDADITGQSSVFTFDASMGDKLTCDAGILPTPVIATVKSIVGSNVLSNGHIDITFELGLKNIGSIDLTNISLTDNLMTQLGSAFVNVSAASPNLSILSSTATTTPMLNTTYNGSTIDDFFVGAPTDLLEPGQEIRLMLIAEIDPLLASWPLMNQTDAQGDGLDENGMALTFGGLPVRALDQSDSGYSFDTTNPGEPGDNGTSDDPTQITCTPANVIITGEPSGVCPGDGVTLTASSNIPGATYEWRIVGTSTVISTSANPTFNGLTTDVDYEVTAINSTAACIYDLLDTTSITVFTAPVAAPTASYSLSLSCAPADLTLMSVVTIGSAAIVTYDWTGPNGWTSNVQNPVIPNATSVNNGAYTLVATDANGCSVQESIQISTIADPQAQPVISGTGPACIGESITLSAPEYSGAVVSYAWTTPSGTNTGISGVGTNEIIISPIDNTIHPGTYSLQINVDGCVLNANYNVITFAAPTAAVAYVTTDTCSGGTIELEGTGTGTAPLSYLWAGPNGFTSSLQNISISGVDESYNGLYSLTVISASGCSGTASTTVDNILPASVAPEIGSNGPAICDGDTLFLSTSAIGDNFEWIRNSDSAGSLAQPGMTTTTGSTAIPPDHPEYSDGPWRIRVTDDNGCAQESAIINVTINPIPTAIASNSGPVCEELSIQLYANEITDGVYRWYDNDPGGAPAGVLISTDRDPIINDLTPGTHDFYLTTELNGCGSSVAMTTAVIQTAPTVAPAANYTLASDCAPADLSLLANVTAGTGVVNTYQWTGPNNFTSTIQNPVIPNVSAAYNGSYYLEVTDENGCTAEGSVQITNIQDAFAMPIINNTGPDCEGGVLSLSVPEYTAASVDYTWTTPAGTTTNITGLNTNQITISPLVTGTHEGQYYVTIAVDGCTLESDTFDLDVLAIPSAIPSATTGIICEGAALDLTANASGATEYTWTGPNNFTSNAQNPTINNATASANGTYTLVISNSSNCTSTESIIVNNISPTPVTPSITSNAPVCADNMISLAIQQQYTGTTIAYNWTNGAGATISTAATATLATTSANTISPYRLEVTVDGCTSEMSEAVEVGVITLPIATATSSGSICPGEDVQLFAGDVVGANYEWRVSGNSTVISTNQNPTIFGLSSTTVYEVTVITDGCISDPVSTTTVTVNTPPTLAPTINYIVNGDCSPSALALTAGVTVGSAAIIDYQWTGPNGWTAAIENPSIPAATEEYNGSYTLTTTDANGCTATASLSVNTIVDPVTVPVINSTGPACEGKNIVLNVPEYLGSSVTYTWTTPNGTTNISGLNTNEIIISPVDETLHEGNYSVVVVVDGCTLTSADYNVVAFDTPVLASTVAVADSCTGGVIELNAGATGTNPLSYQWVGPNGFVSNLENPTITDIDVANNGQYILTVSSASGCIETRSLTFDNIQLPGEIPSIDAVTSICQGDTIRLLTSTDGDTFEWIQNSDSQGSLNLPGMRTTVPNTVIPPDHPLYENGPWKVRVISANGCSEESAIVNVVINEIPLALADNNGPTCEGASIQLLSNTITDATYRWYDGDPSGVPAGNLISMEQNPDLNNLTSGTHEFYLTIENNGCESDASMTTVIINAEPTLAPTASYMLANNCAPSDLTLNANAMGTGLTYAWTGPNNFSSGIQNPTIPDATEDNNGSYTLVITDANNCIASASVEVVSIVDAVPMPIINHAGPECDGDEIVLNVPQYQGSAVDYVWTTPAGTTVNISGLNTNQIVISPAITATHEGEYSVEITVDGCVLNSDTFDLDVNTIPTLSPAATTGIICEGTVLNLLANDVNVVSYTWTGPNGFESVAQNPELSNVTTAQNGTYTLVVTTDQGCTATESVVVDNIVPTPITPSITSNQPVCFDETITLSIQEQYTGTISYSWTNGAGTVIGTTSSMTIDADHANAISPYRVTVTVDGCTSDLSPAMLVEVNALPDAIATNAGNICPGETAQLFANPIPGASYQWTISGSTNVISTSQNPTFTGLNATTTYELTVISNGCISNPLSQTTVMVNTEPSVTPSASYTLNTDCSASDLSLTANAVVGSGAIGTYSWTGPNGFVSAEVNPIIPNATASANGSYVLTVIDANGCVATGNVEVTNITNTIAQPIVTSTGPACEGELVVLNVASYSGSSVDYVWTTPSGTTTNITGLNTNEIVISPLVASTHEGEYYVTVSVDGCVLQSDTMEVAVFTQPSAMPSSTSTAMCEGDVLTLTANAMDAVSYSWIGPNGFSSTAENPDLANVTVANNGTYTLTINGEGNCETTESIVVNNIQVTPQMPTITSNGPQCEDNLISLSIQEQYTGTVSYEWTNGAGNTIGTTSAITIIPTTSAAISPYRVIVTVNGCSSPLAAPIEVQVNALPEAIATNGGSICPGEMAQLFANPIPGATYEWRDMSTGAIVSTTQNPSLTINSTTTYQLTVISNGCISNPLSQTTVMVNTEPSVTPSASYTLNTDCSASDLSLTANAVVGSGAIGTYSWTGPNGFVSAEVNPIIPNATAAANGSYILTVIDANGCSATGSVEVTNITNTVVQPVINSSGPACEGDVVVLNVAAYSGSNVTYTWTTPSGTTTNITGLNTNEIVISPLEDATHQGDYSVTISVDGCVLESTIMQVDVFDTPIALPMVANTPICLDGALTLEANATGVGLLSYNWSGPNGFNSESENPSLTNVTVAANGLYTLTVTSTSGCTTVENVVVNNILPAPEVPTLEAIAAICDGEAMVLTTSTVGVLYEWIGPLGASAITLTKPGLTTTTNTTTIQTNYEAYLPGSWSVKVTDANGCTSISTAVEVSINEIPIAQAFNSGSICADEAVQLSATNVNGATYEWRIAGSPTVISTLQNPIITDLDATTIYELTVINNTCVSDPVATTTVVVNETPILTPSATYNLSTDCSPSDLNLFANVLSTGIVSTYEWLGPNGYTSAVENPVIPNATEANNGSYTLVVTDENGCTNAGSFEVIGIVDDLAQPVITSSGPACEGETIVLSIPAYSGANVDYHWDLPNNVNITGQNSNQITISPADATLHEGLYFVVVEVDDCELTSDFFIVDVFETPTIAPEATAIDLCEGEILNLLSNATNAESYYWTGPNGFISTAENPELPNISVNNNGTYTLQVTSESGCTLTESVVVNNIALTPQMPTITSNTPVCEDDLILLSIQEQYQGINVSYNWTNGAGTTFGVGSAVSISANAPNAISPYRVSVTIDGCTSPISIPVEVDVVELPTASASNNGFVCQGDDVQLFAGPVENGTYEWRVVGNTTLISTEQNPIIYNMVATTTYELAVISNSGCFSSAVSTTTVEVNMPPEVLPAHSYTINSDCSPSDLALIANVVFSDADIVNYQWTGPNGYTSAIENPTIPDATEDNNGSYTLTVMDEFGCTATGSIEVTDISNQIAQPILSSTGPACTGAQVIINVPQYLGAAVDYQWTLPNTTNVTGLNTNQIVISPVDGAIHEGTYSVTVMIDGCTINSDTYVLEVFEQPVIAPTATATDLCESGILNLAANVSSPASGLTYEWIGPNGFTSNAINPEIANITVANNGTYTLTVGSTSGCVTTESIVVNNISLQPEQPLILADTEVCVNEAIELTIQQTYTGNLITYNWYNAEGTLLGNGSELILSADDPNAISPYYVTVDVDGCAAEQSAAIEVIVTELPEATALNNGPVCIGSTVQLIGGEVPGGSYFWYDGNPQSAPPGSLISTDQNPLVFDLTEGTHQYYLIVETNGCASSTAALTTVEVNAQPGISGISGSGSYCQGSTVTLSAVNTIPSIGNVVYTWVGPNGFSYSATTGWEGPFTVVLPNVSPDAEGTYSLNLTTESGCTAQVQSVNIDLDATPITPNLAISADFLCEGSLLELNSTAFTGTPVVYEWFFEDATTGAVTSLGTTDLPTFFIDNVSGLNSGIYTVQVTVDGCESQPSNAQDVLVFGNVAPPQATNSTTATLPACEGSAVTLTIPVIIGATYEWFGPNGFNSSLPNPVIPNITMEAAGEYYAIVELNGCASVISISTEVFVQETLDSPTIVNNGPWCEGGDVTISVSSPLNIPPGVTVTFDWYTANGNALVGTTTDPEITLTALNASNSGDYYVIMTVGDCATPLSSFSNIQINAVPANEADAGADQAICSSTIVELDAETPTVGSGFWTSPTGATISNPEQPDAEAIDLEEGDNMFIWTLSNGACENYDADTVIITVSLNPIDVAFAGNDFDICGSTNTTLQAVIPQLAVGTWTQTSAQASLGIIIVDPEKPNTEITGLQVGNEYMFTWTLSQGVCEDFATDDVIVSVNEAPLLDAFVFESELYSCGEVDAVIAALEPSTGTGLWSTTTPGVTIVDPLEFETIVDDLRTGANVFVWTLSNGVCENYSSDTMVVYLEDELMANADHYELNFRDTLINADLMDNDFVGNIEDWQLTLLEGPRSGTIEGTLSDGQITYQPNSGFFGQDQLIYEICNVNCSSVCDTALVTIRVAGTEETGDCWVPNIVTPNNDGLNDQLIIPCLDTYLDNELRVYNRWGDRVHLSRPYNNDWDSTFKGELLPAGTYFYILKLTPDSEESLQGYFTIIR